MARLGAVVWLLAKTSALSAPPTMGEQSDGSVLVPSNQLITPAGKMQRIEGERPKDLAFSPDGKLFAVLAQTRVFFFAADGRLIAQVALKAGPLGLAWIPDSQSVFVSGDNGQVYRLTGNGGRWKISGSLIVADKIEKSPHPDKSAPSFEEEVEWRPLSPESHHLQMVEKPSKHHGNPQVTGLAVSSDGQRLYVALGIRNAVVVVDLETESVIATVPVGVAPYRVALSPNGKTLFVANRGAHTRKRVSRAR
jgi:YVTN family beta-propeller protein